MKYFSPHQGSSSHASPANIPMTPKNLLVPTHPHTTHAMRSEFCWNHLEYFTQTTRFPLAICLFYFKDPYLAFILHFLVTFNMPHTIRNIMNGIEHIYFKMHCPALFCLLLPPWEECLIRVFCSNWSLWVI